MHPGSDMRAVGGGSLGECGECEHPFDPDEDAYEMETDRYPYRQIHCGDCAWALAAGEMFDGVEAWSCD